MSPCMIVLSRAKRPYYLLDTPVKHTVSLVSSSLLVLRWGGGGGVGCFGIACFVSTPLSTFSAPTSPLPC